MTDAVDALFAGAGSAKMQAPPTAHAGVDALFADAAKPASSSTSPSLSWRDYLGALPETAAQMGSGMAGQVAGGLAGLGELAAGRGAGTAAQRVSQVEDAMTYQPRTRGGQDLSNIVGYLPRKLGQMANWAGGKVADLTGSPALGTATNTGIQGLPFALGSELPFLRDFKESSLSPEAAAARGIGIKLTPTQAQAPGGIIGRTVESLMGHAKLERNLSRPNAAAVTQAAGKDIGIEGAVTPATVKAAKAPFNAVYNEVRQLGNVPVDDAFRARVAAINNPGSGSFAFDVPADIARLKEGYGALQQFNANDAVDKVLDLREQSRGNMSSPSRADKNLGRAQKKIADALEDQIERHLASPVSPPAPAHAADYDVAQIGTHEGPKFVITNNKEPVVPGPGIQPKWYDTEEVARGDIGKLPPKSQAAAAPVAPAPVAAPDLMRRYRDARVALAKIHSVEDALKAGKNQAVSAKSLAKQYERGVPLTGNLRTIAEAYQHFPRALQDLHRIRDSGPLSGLDLRLGLLDPKAAPLLLAQPAVRFGLGSDLYQRAAFGPRTAPSVPRLVGAGRALPLLPLENRRALSQ